MLYLAIETSSIRGSVGLFSESEWIRQLDLDEGLTCGDELLSRISTLLEDHRTTVSSLDGVAVSVGPGSYTGTRVGVTAAKTLSWACQLPVSGLETLPLLAANAGLAHVTGLAGNGLPDAERYYVATILDGRQHFLYGALYEVERSACTWPAASRPRQIVPQSVDDATTLWSVLEQRIANLGDAPVVAIGDGAEQLLTLAPSGRILRGPQALDYPSARALGSLSAAELKTLEWDADRTHRLEPLYMRATEAERKLMNRATG